MEAIFDELQGVLAVESGYMGGHLANPDYRTVCAGKTGHTEVVQITFDPAVTPYRDILEIFFAVHDPTSRDRQGDDVGQQYRSVIFYHSEAQRETAAQMIAKLEPAFSRPIVTELRPAADFYVAEDYHQEYFRNNPQQQYCALVVSPKVRKFREKFAKKLRLQANRPSD
jgi:peptide-methionine (S)-S-oxide reductase